MSKKTIPNNQPKKASSFFEDYDEEDEIRDNKRVEKSGTEQEIVPPAPFLIVDHGIDRIVEKGVMIADFKQFSTKLPSPFPNSEPALGSNRAKEHAADAKVDDESSEPDALEQLETTKTVESQEDIKLKSRIYKIKAMLGHESYAITVALNSKHGQEMNQAEVGLLINKKV